MNNKMVNFAPSTPNRLSTTFAAGSRLPLHLKNIMIRLFAILLLTPLGVDAESCNKRHVISSTDNEGVKRAIYLEYKEYADIKNWKPGDTIPLGIDQAVELVIRHISIENSEIVEINSIMFMPIRCTELADSWVYIISASKIENQSITYSGKTLDIQVSGKSLDYAVTLDGKVHESTSL
ncbi:hypothetical protein ACJJID_09405 [Microbulbifer sp. CnH-101-G]|uniref:hypothetical protein n=1 Tax=Microbulbifer sp. CnH-101-G TaxID=3243393 RepID=UPI00403A065D